MSEMRKDPITNRWVIIRTERGAGPSMTKPSHEEPEPALCPFCEGNEHMTPAEIFALRNLGTSPNGKGWQVRVVANRFPVLGIEGDLGKEGHGLFDKMNGIGAHEMIIESPAHGDGLNTHGRDVLTRILEVYRLRMLDLIRDLRFHYILVFRNEGHEAGGHLRHPHSQIVATPVTPREVKSELRGAQDYFRYKDRCIFCDMIRAEKEDGRRVVWENRDYISFCPFASRSPFEMWILPKEHSADFHRLTSERLVGMAEVLDQSMKRLARALDRPQYNMVLHSGPNRRERRDYWQTIDHDFHWHMEIIPRFTPYSGFEWGTGFFINPTPPEESAAFLREMKIS